MRVKEFKCVPPRRIRRPPAPPVAACRVPSAPRESDKTPFTIITGFLGAGKTTLINYILTEQRQKRICIVENEFGEINIDEKLVVDQLQSKEDLVTMDNGCACCSVRGDLIKTLGGLVERRKQVSARARARRRPRARAVCP